MQSARCAFDDDVNGAVLLGAGDPGLSGWIVHDLIPLDDAQGRPAATVRPPRSSTLMALFVGCRPGMPDREDLLRARCPAVADAVAFICWIFRWTALGTISACNVGHDVGSSLGAGDVLNADNSTYVAKRSVVEFSHAPPGRGCFRLGWWGSPSCGLRWWHALRLPCRVRRAGRARQRVDAPICGHRNAPAEHAQVLS
jgi:hypothetical protein